MSYDVTEQAAIDRLALYNANRYDAGSNAYGMAGPGYKINITASLTDVSIAAAAIAQEASLAGSYAALAQNAISGGLVTTSTTSLAIGTGTKVFTTSGDLDNDVPIADAMWLKAVSQADSNKWMIGTVTSAAGTTLTVSVTRTSGSGTVADWSIMATGAPGVDGTLDLHGQTSTSSLDGDDELLLYDASAGALRKALFSDFLIFNQIMMEPF